MQDIHIKHEDKNNITLKKKRSTAALLSQPDLGGIANREAEFKRTKNILKTKRSIHFNKHFLGFSSIAIILCLIFSGFIAFNNLQNEKQGIETEMHGLMQQFEILQQHASQGEYAKIKQDAQIIKQKIAESSKTITELSSQKSLISGDPLGTYAQLFDVLQILSESVSNTINSIPENLLDIDPQELSHNITEAANSLNDAEQKIKNINLLNIPSEYRANIKELQSLIQETNIIAQEYRNTLPNILASIGYPDPKTYLILLQNTGERRPTGGFIGAFALIDFNDGQMTDLQIHDVYDFDARLYEKVKAPESLAPYRDNIALRDSNHNPDFPTTAKSASWFLEHEGGPSVDGVIAIDDQILASLLTISGDIELKTDFGTVTFTADNYFEILEYIIESSKDHPNTPKQVLIDLVFAMKDQFEEDPKKYSQDLLLLFREKMAQKDIQMFFKDAILQDFAKQMNIDNNIKKETHDAVAVLLTSLSGNKSDKYMQYKMKHETKINSQDEIINTLSIKSQHTWDDNKTQFFYEQFPDLSERDEFNQKEILSIIGQGPNSTLYRILVPSQSELLYTAGIPKHEVAIRQYSNDFDSLEFLLETKEEQSRQISLTYKIPTIDIKNYSFEWIKQPGHNNYQFKKIWDNKGERIQQDYNINKDLNLRFPH